MKNILVIESCPGTPHTDTSLEIAIREKMAGSNVYFGCLFPFNGIWEFATQYTKSSHLALTGFILENISSICEKWNIKVLIPDIKRKLFTKDDFNNYIIEKKRFNDKWDLFTVMKSNLANFTATRDPDLIAIENSSTVYTFCEVAINTYFATKRLIELTKPDLIYYYNGRWTSCAPIEWAGNDLGIKLLQHERGADTNKFALFDTHYYRLEDRKRRIKKISSITDEDIVRIIGSSWFFDKKNRIEKVWPSPTSHQHRNSIPVDLQCAKYICYFTSSEDEMGWIPGNQVEVYLGKQYDIFLELKKMCQDLNLKLVVRVHPAVAAKPNEAHFWNSQRDENTYVIDAANPVDSYALLDRALIVISYSSTIGLEAAFWGKPSVLLGNSEWFNEPGFICPKTSNELFSILQAPPTTTKIPKFTYAFGFYTLTFGENFKFFEPQGFWSGKFLDHKLQPSTIGI